MAIPDNHESIEQVEITPANELLLILSSRGKPHYQYIYREAAGVYWDSDRKGFKSSAQKEMPFSEWFRHMVAVINSGLGVQMHLAEKVIWLNVDEDVRRSIEASPCVISDRE